MRDCHSLADYRRAGVSAILALLFLPASGLLVRGSAAAPAASPKAPAIEFTAPRFDAPYYRVRFPFEVRKEKAGIRDLSLNDARVRSYLIFKQGKPADANAFLEPGVYDVVLDYAWSSGKTYAASLLYQTEGSPKLKKYQVKGISPGEGGIPGGEEGFYRAYTVEEEAGLARAGETVALTVTAPVDELKGASLVIFDGSRAVPFEVTAGGESTTTEKAAATHPSTITHKIVLRLSAAAHEKKWLLVLKGKSPEPPGDIRLSGDGLGKTVRTPHLTLELSPRSGQINSIEWSDPAVRLYNNAGVIHWNPDVYVQGLGWDHSFDWNPPPSFEDRAGSLVYVNSRKGPLPHIPDVLLEVKYTVEAGSPYFISETRLRFEKDLGVIAVRNDEMVVYKELFDSLIYKDKSGGLVKLPLKEKEGFPFGLVHTAPADADWVGLMNSAQGYGFFSLRITAAEGNLELPGPFPLKAGTCFYAPSDGNYVYWVRALIYTWADFFTNTLHSFVPKGSFFYEKNAYGIWRITPDLAQRLDDSVMKLKSPLRVY